MISLNKILKKIPYIKHLAMYSQNSEQQYILDHFKGKTGTFLDLGAYNGIDLSNTRALMELGWAGVCVEPHPTIFSSLKENCKNFPLVFCYKCAIGTKNGVFNLHANDTYYSTLVESELKRWEGQYEFKEMECLVWDWKTFKRALVHTTFEFISIDCEGLDYEILTQIDLDEVGCKMICIETNGIETEKYIKYISQFEGFEVLVINAENLIMVR